MFDTIGIQYHEYDISVETSRGMADDSPDGSARLAPAAPAGMPARMRRPRREDVRRRLLSAALALFSERGYDRTSLEQVAAAAGFSKGAVYSNFASKDELFLALMDSQVRRRIEQVRTALEAPHDQAQTLQLAGGRLTRALSEDRDWQLLFLDYVQRAARDPEAGARLAGHRRQIRHVVADAIRDLGAVGDDEDTSLDLDALAVTVLALSNGLAIERVTDHDAVPDDLLGRILSRLLPASEPSP